MHIDEIAIADLNVIYLSYDEPQKEKFWLQIKEIIPWAKRVDGIAGSDNAHKAAANISTTERFIVIDGDNLPDPNFFKQKLIINDINFNSQFRWRARNNVNGLYYGNGGISCWTKTHVLNMRTHENSNGDTDTLIEFCFDPNYWAMQDCWSTTYPHYSPKQAWRAGFREGVKLCTQRGKPPPSTQEFKNWVSPRNVSKLLIWQSVGRDVENGSWAIYGARLGMYYLLFEDWDYRKVKDFLELDNLWLKHSYDSEDKCIELGNELNKRLGLDIVELDKRESFFFKTYSRPKWKNIDIMMKQSDSTYYE